MNENDLKAAKFITGTIVCGSECTESRHETTVIISRFEYCYMGNRQGKYKKTYDLCDTCGDKLDALIAPKAK